MTRKDDAILLSLLVFASFVAGFMAFPMALYLSQPLDVVPAVDNTMHSNINNIDDAYLEGILTDVMNEEYIRHVYVNDSYVCLDYAINMWDVLYARGITSSLMIGNNTVPCYDFKCADHAWVVVRTNTTTFALETTRGTVVRIGPDDIHLKAMEYNSPIAFKNAWARYNKVSVIY